LNNGLDNPSKTELVKEEFNKILGGRSSKHITERALRYDLTIPFARYVAMNHGQLTFPFKRYQVQPVWRADRPQKGRYREFYQCDADVVGSNSLLNEVEFVHIYNEVFGRLGMGNYRLKINSRKILTALAERCGGAEKMMDITIAIDKLDKIGHQKVNEELAQRGLGLEQIGVIEQYLQINGSNEQKLAAIEKLFEGSDTGKKGIEELRYVLFAMQNGEQALPEIDLTLARGLNYYTGIIFEAKAPAGVTIGSIGGGGRYDDLTGLFGVPGVPGVGISFGVDRIYDVMEELNLFPQTLEQGSKVLFFNLGVAESKAAYVLLQALRNSGIPCEIFHEGAKLEKQFKYAEKKNIPFVVIIGNKELENGNCVLKNIHSGLQKTVTHTQLLQESFSH
jgi:histidyl-tRNA synthetase